MRHEVALGVDATNIRGGGGITYLRGLFANEAIVRSFFDRVIVWGGPWVNQLSLPAWIEVRISPELGGATFAYDLSAVRRIYHQLFASGRAAHSMGCAVAYFPGGALPLSSKGGTPIAVISRNLLPFCIREIARHRISFETLRLIVLRRWYKWSMRHANGVVFLTEFSKRTITSQVRIDCPTVVIPHGITDIFRQREAPEPSRSANSFQWVYTSTLAPYKHQDKVAAAVRKLRDLNIDVSAVFCGPGSPKAIDHFRKLLRRLDPEGGFLAYLGSLKHEDLVRLYRTAQGFVFASTCENLPNILVEAMAAGMAIVCSRAGPMPEVLQDGGILCDTTNIDELVGAMRRMMEASSLREEYCGRARRIAAGFSWERCATDTLRFLRSLAERQPLQEAH